MNGSLLVVGQSQLLQVHPVRHDNRRGGTQYSLQLLVDAIPEIADSAVLFRELLNLSHEARYGRSGGTLGTDLTVFTKAGAEEASARLSSLISIIVPRLS